MAHYLHDKCFKKIEEAVEAFASKSVEWNHQGIQNLADRWIQTMNYDGLYFEN